MVRFLTTIFIIVAVYYGIKYLARLLFPLLMKRVVNKMTGGQFNQFQQQEQEPTKKEGEVTITNKKKKDSNKIDDSGDYVDYEEIKD